MLTVSDGSKVLGVKPRTLRRWASKGLVRAFQTPGGHYRIPRSEITRLLLNVAPASGGVR